MSSGNPAFNASFKTKAAKQILFVKEYKGRRESYANFIMSSNKKRKHSAASTNEQRDQGPMLRFFNRQK
jgi:hypothetical protein